MSARIFICYRRNDSAGFTGRLHDRLLGHFSKEQIFIDVDTIAPGEDFVDVIETAVRKCSVILVIIGRNWLKANDAHGKQALNNELDFVRIEIRTALEKNITVIPVLVDNAVMPLMDDLPKDIRSLSRKNAVELRHSGFSTDADKLIRYLHGTLRSVPDDVIVNKVPAARYTVAAGRRDLDESSDLARLLTDPRSTQDVGTNSNTRKFMAFIERLSESNTRYVIFLIVIVFVLTTLVYFMS